MTDRPDAPARPEAASAERGPGLPEIDVREWGGKRDGERQVTNRRMFFQLMVFDASESIGSARDRVAVRLREAGVSFVLYQDLNAPRGLGVLTWAEDPVHFVTRVQPAVDDDALTQRHEFTMLGRTYSIGHEPELEHALLQRPVDYVLHDGWDWAIWYPLRRSGAFEKLDKHEQAVILKEHASIGMAYGRADLAHDVRLACHGMDGRDNEFVVGLVGQELHPLSHVVQSMRHTKQTSEFIVQMGPFFVGRAVARHREVSRG